MNNEKIFWEKNSTVWFRQGRIFSFQEADNQTVISLSAIETTTLHEIITFLLENNAHFPKKRIQDAQPNHYACIDLKTNLIVSLDIIIENLDYQPHYHLQLKLTESFEQQWAWEQLQQNLNKKSVKQFLKHYPQGEFAEKAENLLQSWKTENKFWLKTLQNNSKEAYQLYIEQYPQGRYLKIAQYLTTYAEKNTLWEAIGKQVKKTLQHDYQHVIADKNQLKDFKAILLHLEQESEVWNYVQLIDDLEAYLLYLQRFPEGRFAEEAKQYKNLYTLQIQEELNQQSEDLE